VRSRCQGPVQIVSLLFTGLCCLAASAQQASAPSAALTPQEIVRKADQAVATPGNFRVSSVEVQVDSYPLRHDESTVYREAMRGPNNRFRIETRTFQGSWVQASDGVNETIAFVEDGRYLKHPLTVGRPTSPHLLFGGNQELSTAWSTLTFLERRLADARELSRLPDEAVSLGGQTEDCFVVHAARTSSDNADSKRAETFWIEKKTYLVRKEEQVGQSYLVEGHIPFQFKTTTTYPIMAVETSIPEEVFAYVPPASFKVTTDLTPSYMRGRALPPPEKATRSARSFADLRFHGKDGILELSSLHGHAVLIDLWATWCAPCLVDMPVLAAVAERYRAAGLVVISVDEDKTADEAAAYLQVHGYTWQNFHGDDALLKRLNGAGIPHTILLDRDGSVIFEKSGDAEAELSTALAQLYPSVRSAH
jgi:thiol-disulfide isomerase/thioredoxin